MTNSNSLVWEKYLKARKKQTPRPSHAEEERKVGHHNEAKNITYEKATLQSSKSLPKE